MEQQMIVLIYLVAFRERHFWSRILGNSLGGSHPQVGDRCYIPKKFIFDSMKNLTHATKDVNITDSLKAAVFYLGEKFTSCIFRWLRRGSKHLISHRKGLSSVD